MNNKKIIFIIIGLILFSAIIGGVYWYLARPEIITPSIQDICGDNICSDIEKFSKSCSEDCETPLTKEIVPFGFYGPMQISAYFADKNIYVRNRDYKTFAKILKEAGADWVYAFDVAIYKGGLDFIDAFSKEGFFISGGVPNGFGRLEEGLYLPKDLVSYRNSLKDYFKKYGMIKHWQYGDEFDGSYFNDTAENFAVMFRIAYKTLKEVNPQAEFVLGKEQSWVFTFMEGPPSVIEGNEIFIGLYNSKTPRQLMFGLKLLKELKLLEEIEKNPQKDNKYKNNPEISQTEYELIFEKDNLEQYIDGVILPLWHPELKITEAERVKVINNLRQYNLHDKILQWNVDAGSWYGCEQGIFNPEGSIDLCPTFPPEEILERAGSRDLIADTYIPLFAAGVEKIGYGGYLINSDGSKRLEWFTHKLMAEKLKGFSSVEKLADGQHKFIFQNKNPVWVLWHDGLGTKIITLDVGNIPAVKITKAIPKYNSGKEVKDYSAAFETRTAAVSNGKITLTLDEKPVYVEETITTEASLSHCPQYMPPAPGWCDDGRIIQRGDDERGCPQPPQCEKD